ncbi:MAG: hypothetical protein AAGD38_05385 [Acidobacteriota bacterium]
MQSGAYRALAKRIVTLGPRAPFLLVHRAVWYVARRLLGPRHFELGDTSYPYLVHPFILDNERAVEIPMASVVARRGGRVLEVGNVLSAYADFGQTVVDKYEEAPDVLNVDIVDYRPSHRFDTVVSISTLEHVGRDEQPQQPEKALVALAHLETLLKPGGRLLVTIPTGYNSALDHALATGRLDRFAIRCLERFGRWNAWRETTLDTALTRGYGSTYPCANALVVLTRE